MKARIQQILGEVNRLLEMLIREVEENYRPVTPEDFKNINGNQLRAMFFNPKGNIYLDNGVEYTIRYMKDRNKVSIPYSYNPHAGTNSGYECSLKNFYIKRDE